MYRVDVLIVGCGWSDEFYGSLGECIMYTAKKLTNWINGGEVCIYSIKNDISEKIVLRGLVK